MIGRMPQRRKEKSRMRELSEYAVTWGWRISRCLTDRWGMYCLKLDTAVGPMYCITKERPYQDNASFPRRVVERAVAHGVPLAIFFGEPRLGNSYVFDPVIVGEEGILNRATGASRGEKMWLDIPLDRGVVVGDYVSGRSGLQP